MGLTVTSVCTQSGTSSAEDAMAVSSTQLKVQKLMHDLAFSKSGLLPGMLTPPAAGILPMAGPNGAAPHGQLALVPVMVQNTDGKFVGAYQVQPYPAGFSSDANAPELAGMRSCPFNHCWHHFQNPALCLRRNVLLFTSEMPPSWSYSLTCRMTAATSRHAE